MNTSASELDIARILGVNALVLSDLNLQLCFNLLDQGVDPRELAHHVKMILKEQNKI